MLLLFVIAISLLATAHGQLVGKEQIEVKPNITWEQCTGKGECSKRDGKITLDFNWRWLHQVSGYLSCFEWSDWNTYNGCKNNTDCTKICATEGADYKRTYSITTNQSSLRLQYVTKVDFSQNVASRNYLMKDNDTYEIFKLAPNREISFDVDVSKLPCGLSGSLYFVAMDADGGMSRYPTNKAGAKYGTGYCDASCPQNLRFINGEANMEGWIPPEDWQDQDGGKGVYGSCCAELDIWDSNSISTALTAKPCTTIEQTRCTGEGCGPTFSQDQYQGVCDPDGCDFNPYRMGNKNFYGRAKVVDTSKKFTVVTQFIGSGEDLEIKRFYVQNGTVIQNSQSEVAGVSGNSLTTKFCAAQKQAFGDVDAFNRKGGMAQVSKALEKGMVMVFRIWDDDYANHLWLDSIYPPDRDPTAPGVARGECDRNTGVPRETQLQYPDAAMTFSNIKFGEINSTFG